MTANFRQTANDLRHDMIVALTDELKGKGTINLFSTDCEPPTALMYVDGMYFAAHIIAVRYNENDFVFPLEVTYAYGEGDDLLIQIINEKADDNEDYSEDLEALETITTQGNHRIWKDTNFLIELVKCVNFHNYN